MPKGKQSKNGRIAAKGWSSMEKLPSVNSFCGIVLECLLRYGSDPARIRRKGEDIWKAVRETAIGVERIGDGGSPHFTDEKPLQTRLPQQIKAFPMRRAACCSEPLGVLIRCVPRDGIQCNISSVGRKSPQSCSNRMPCAE